MTRRKSIAEEDPTSPTFEADLASLESIVEAMEHDQLPLEDLVAYYEKGSALLDRCESILQTARGRIELITLRHKPESEAANPSPAGESPEPFLPSGLTDATDDDDDDDIRLF
jgi:exodeoxyribonuclease VII small subunit